METTYIPSAEELQYEEEFENISAEEDIAPINYHNITHDDMLNGDGLRVVLWVAGCSHCCKDCQNPSTWDERGGIPFTQWDEAEFWTWLDKPWTKGATFSGGDPFHCANRHYVGVMAKKIKETRPDKDIWAYTGYTLKYSESEGFYFEDEVIGETFKYPALPSFDVIVDGRFEIETRKADIASGKTSLWRGSSNQRVIDVKESLSRKKIVARTYNNDGSWSLTEVE